MAELATERPPIEGFLPLIRAKAQEVHREHVGYVELDDLVQEVAVWWLTTNAATLREYAYEPRQLRLRRAIWRVARDAAVKYRRQYGHDEAFVQVRYRAREVLELLPVAMDPDGLPDGGGIKDGPRAHGNLAEGGDVLASLIDVRTGLARLHPEDRIYLSDLRSARWDYALIAEADGVEPDSVRRKTARIAQKIADYLNNEETEAA